MKRILSTLFALIIAVALFAQPDTTAVIQEESNAPKIEKPEKTTVKIGRDEVVVIEEGKDTTKIVLGNRGITIVEGPDGTKVDVENLKKYENKDNGKSNKKFKPHWAGIELGINNYLNSDGTMSLRQEESFMDLRTSRSWNINVNMFEYGFGFGTNKLGLVTGLGLELNNYHFTGNNNIIVDENDMVVEYFPPRIEEPGSSVKKSKLHTNYLTAPLLLEGQIPAGKKRIYLSAGVIGGLKIFSKTKMVYEIDNKKQKDNTRDDFNLSLLRYGFTARAGYRALRFYATYYPTPLFMAGKGPELYPFSIGLTLGSF